MNAAWGTVPKTRTVTLHAVERYQQRWAPDLSLQEARAELLALLNSARPDGRTRDGSAVLVSGERPEVRMVMRDERVCVTVLPPDRHYLLQREMSDILEEIEAESKLREERSKLFRIDQLTHSLSKLKAELEALEKEREEIRQSRRGISDLDFLQAASKKLSKLGDRKGTILQRIKDIEKELEK